MKQSLKIDASSEYLQWGSKAYSDRVDEIRKLLSTARSVFSIAHPHSDGDALGSQLALHNYCKSHGINSVCLNFEPIPTQISWLEGSNELRDNLPTDVSFDLGFLMETTDASRMGDRVNFFEKATTCIHLDHHIGVKGLGKVNLLDQDASSTCEILFNILKGLDPLTDHNVLSPLYTGIMTDTGNFRYNNTTQRAHEIAAHCIKHGLRIPDIFSQVFENRSFLQILINGLAMSRIKRARDPRLVYTWLTQEDYRQTGASDVDTDGCIRHLCVINGVEAALLFKETDTGKVKISFRSIDKVDVRKVAMAFGGGGHKLAAGAQVGLPMDEAMAQITEAVCASMVKELARSE